MRNVTASLAALLVATTAHAQPLGGEHSTLKDVAASVSEARQRATIEALVGFGTRHTMSETKSDKRGIGAARRWVAAKFASISKDCGGKLTVATPSQMNIEIWTLIELAAWDRTNGPRSLWTT